MSTEKPSEDRRTAASTNEPASCSEEFLLKEYEHESSFFLSNEESGDKRVTFLWTLAAAVLGGLGALATSDKIKEKHIELFLIVGCLATAFVVVFGWLTLLRTIRRNLITDEHKRNLKRVEKYFVKHDPEVRKFLPHDPDERVKRDALSYWPFHGKGGYVETVILLNSVLGGLFAGFVAMLLFSVSIYRASRWLPCLPHPIWEGIQTHGVQAGQLVLPLLVAILAGVAFWRVQVRLANEKYKEIQQLEAVGN